MRVLLFVLAVLAVINGVMVSSEIVSAIQQIVQYLSFLIAAVFLVGAAIIDTMIKHQIKEEK